MNQKPHLIDSRDVWVVVPAFNESTVIDSVIKPLIQARYTVVVVDDGSSDDTSSIAREAGALVLRHAVNAGQGAALGTGIKFAVEEGAPYVCTYDADGQHRPSDIEVLADNLVRSGADIALGSRFLGSTENISVLRRFLLKCAVLFTRTHTGLILSDTHNGLRLMTQRAASQIRILQPRMAHASEILARIAQLNLKYVEVPVTITYSEYSTNKGQTTLGALRIVFDLLIARALK